VANTVNDPPLQITRGQCLEGGPDGTTGRTTAWIKLTEPGGKPIHINVEHVTSVRSDTQIPGAKAQLDLTSGKFQGVQEDVERVMQLISTPGAREDDETPSAAL
jgi:uncharacterized protein YlzI (FlbEa/FlbD family)